MAHVFRKPYIYLVSKAKWRKSLSALLITLLSLVAIVIPIILVSLIVLNQMPVFIEMINNKWPELEELFLTGWVSVILENIGGMAGDDFNLQEKLAEFSTGAVTLVMNLVERSLVNVTFLVFHFFLVLILLYYLLLGKDDLMKKIHEVIPLPDREEKAMFDRMYQVTDSIIYGTFVIGLSEGIFGGVIFWIVGVEGPLFWGMMMTILSMIPILGANGILVPAGIIMILSGNLSGGLVVLLVGAVVVQISQNVIKPKVVGDKMNMHAAIVLLSMIGGIFWLGLIGFLVGPLIAAICLTVYDQFRLRFKDELKEWNES